MFTSHLTYFRADDFTVESKTAELNFDKANELVKTILLLN